LGKAIAVSWQLLSLCGVVIGVHGAAPNASAASRLAGVKSRRRAEIGTKNFRTRGRRPTESFARTAPHRTATVVILYSCNTTGATMAVSVRLDPLLDAKLTQQANLLGVTKSDFIKDAIERVLGLKDPAALLKDVRSGGKLGRRDASANVSRQMKAKLRAQRPD
jgi:RHH-type rel operon transcriptional repressor/antitoxin RelB